MDFSNTCPYKLERGGINLSSSLSNPTGLVYFPEGKRSGEYHCVVDTCCVSVVGAVAYRSRQNLITWWKSYSRGLELEDIGIRFKIRKFKI